MDGIKNYKINFVLLVLSSISYIFMNTIQTNDILGMYKWILLCITIISIVALLVNIVKQYEGNKKYKILFKVVLFCTILMLIIVLGAHYIGGLYSLIIGIIFISLFSKKTISPQ